MEKVAGSHLRSSQQGHQRLRVVQVRVVKLIDLQRAEPEETSISLPALCGIVNPNVERYVLFVRDLGSVGQPTKDPALGHSTEDDDHSTYFSQPSFEDRDVLAWIVLPLVNVGLDVELA